MLHLTSIRLLTNSKMDNSFYKKLLEENSEVTNRQISLYRESKGKTKIVDKPLAALV